MNIKFIKIKDNYFKKQCFREDKSLESEVYYKSDFLDSLNGKNSALIHNELDEPAAIYYTENGRRKVMEIYYVNGKKHRENNKPAIIGYFEDGKNIEYEHYYKDGGHHRINGPAIINYNRDGSIFESIYFIEDIEYSEMEYMIKLDALMN